MFTESFYEPSETGIMKAFKCLGHVSVFLCVYMCVQICSMRDVEKSLKQKLTDVEKMKSQLQNELSNRDRTIQQLRSVNSDLNVFLL